MKKTRFNAGDTITNGRTIHTVNKVVGDSYRFIDQQSLTATYMPTNIVDRLWAPYQPPQQGILEGEIVDE